MKAKATAKINDEAEFNQVVGALHCSGSGSASSGTGTNSGKRHGPQSEEKLTPKKAWMKWATKTRSVMQGFDTKTKTLMEKLNTKQDEPWHTKKFIAAVVKQQAKAHATSQKLIKMIAIHEDCADAVFEQKKFTQLQQEVQQCIDGLQDDKQPIKKAWALLNVA